MFPELVWAQRSNATVAEKNLVYLTIRAADLTEEKVDISAERLSFVGKSGSVQYDISFEWFAPIDVAHSTQHKTGQGITLVLRKADKQEEYWPRLTKDKAKKPYIHTDFDKWVDEDEQEEAPEVPDMGDMGGMGGMGGMDMASLMGGAGGAGGDAGGAGGFDPAQMAQLQQMLAGAGAGAGGEGGFDMSSLMGGQGDAAADDEIEHADEEEPEGAEIKEVQ